MFIYFSKGKEIKRGHSWKFCLLISGYYFTSWHNCTHIFCLNYWPLTQLFVDLMGSVAIGWWREMVWGILTHVYGLLGLAFENLAYGESKGRTIILLIFASAGFRKHRDLEGIHKVFTKDYQKEKNLIRIFEFYLQVFRWLIKKNTFILFSFLLLHNKSTPTEQLKEKYIYSLTVSVS